MLLLSMLLLASISLATKYEVTEQMACRRCIYQGNHYFATPERDGGLCCDDKEVDKGCQMYGIDTTSTKVKALKYFACPTGPLCNAEVLVARRISRIYSVDIDRLDKLSNLCNHEIEFSVDAGPNDILKIDILAAPPGTNITI